MSIAGPSRLADRSSAGKKIDEIRAVGDDIDARVRALLADLAVWTRAACAGRARGPTSWTSP
jgi:hypothetical protein